MDWVECREAQRPWSVQRDGFALVQIPCMMVRRCFSALSSSCFTHWLRVHSCRRAPLVCKPLNRACHTRRFVATIACGVSTTGPGRRRPSHQVTQGEASALGCEMQILPVKRALDGYRLTARSSARARHHTPSSRTRLTTRHIHIDCRARLAPTSRPSCWPSCPVGVAKPLRSHCPRLTLPAARFTVSSHTVIPSRSLFPIPHAVIPHSERRRRGGVGEGVRGTGNHARS